MIKFHAECMQCLLNSAMEKAAPVQDHALRARYIREVCHILSQVDIEHDSAPIADSQIVRLRRELLHIHDDYSDVKRIFNELLMSMQDRLRAQIEAAADPLYASMQLSVAGNYIDFGVLKEVSEDQLMQLLSSASTYQLDRAEYDVLQHELRAGKRCVILHDNCGEVVLDKLMIEQIRRRYPDVCVTSIVRGSNILNDVTLADAMQVGLQDVAEVIPNGVPEMPGTQMDLLPEHVRSVLTGADVIIAKGQGNFETLLDTDLNVYFMLLAKCQYYQPWFGLERFSCVLANAKRMHDQMGIGDPNCAQ